MDASSKGIVMNLKHRYLAILASAVWLFTAQVSLAQVSPGETNPQVIMQAVSDVKAGDKMSATLVLQVTDASGGQRNRKLNVRALNVNEGRKLLMSFTAPSDVKGTGLLSYDYDAASRDDDQWLYLPSVKKSTRIVSNQKSGAFMGTDFTYADMTKANVASYRYKLLKGSDTVNGEDCWVIESVPVDDKTRGETGYMKTWTWVSKSKLLPIRVKAWVIQGKRIKFIQFNQYKQIDGVWVAHQLVAETKRKKKRESQTVMQYSNLRLNDNAVSEDLFTQRGLEKGI